MGALTRIIKAVTERIGGISVRWSGSSVVNEPYLGAWQQGVTGRRRDLTTFSAVYACVSILSSDVAKLPLNIIETQSDGKRVPVTTGPVVAMLRRPNPYQTRVDFWSFMVSSTLLSGNAYAYLERNGRGEVVAMYPLLPDTVEVQLAPDGSVFYHISMSDSLSPARAGGVTVPARDIFHHRLTTMRHPLIGDTPIQACALSSHAGIEILLQSARFFTNLSRPSGILSTDGSLSDTALQRIRAVWRAAQSNDQFGSVAVLDGGMKWQPLAMTATDAQLIDQLKFNVVDVARAFRIPLFMVAEGEKVAYRTTETMMSVYYQQTLSAHLESLEDRLDVMLGLTGTNRETEFDIKRLLRTEFKDRIDGYTKGIQQGLFTPNEARNWEGLGPVEGGDQIYVQSQMVPLSVAAQAMPDEPPDDEPQETEDSEDEVEEPEDEVEEPEEDEKDLRLTFRRRLAA